MAKENSIASASMIGNEKNSLGADEKQRFKTLFNVILDGKTIDAGAEIALTKDQWAELAQTGAIAGEWAN